ncbi:MAG: patatin-like phospholipase family protein [Desulfobacterales bacterium]|nr:MAG: patatin-like phospholipase family protein [Desulfobacterales bacterium]
MSNDQHPFERIALTLSGGGTRAVGFHLGTLSYLDRVGLLEKVRMLSTVSGGSAVGMGYAVYKKISKEEKPLMTLYREMQKVVPKSPAELVGLLQKASAKNPAAPSGRRTLIANMAELYEMIFDFCKDKRFELLWEEGRLHLEEIIFNATEFMTGLAFRFHKSIDNGFSGSESVKLSSSHARGARLADILAASTCIPVGFEPIEFPDDFRWPDDKITVPNEETRRTCNEIRRELPRDQNRPGRQKQSITLMDGGVYDNQGVFSILNILGLTYDSRRDRLKSPYVYNPSDPNMSGMIDGGHDQEPPDNRAANIDLFIVSDTPLRDFPIYEIADKPGRAGFLDLEKLKWIVSITLFLLTGSTLFMGYAYFSHLLSDPARLGSWPNYIWDFFIYIIPLIMLMVCVWGAYFLSRRLKNYLGNLPAFTNNPDLPPKLWNYFKKRKFSDLGYMIQARVSSAFAMSSDVFMNRIRYLGLARILNLTPLRGKVIINVIDTLTRDKKASESSAKGTHKQGANGLNLLEDAQTLCDDTVPKAAKVGTQFWLATEDLYDLLACGQATICYNLLKHMQAMRLRDSAWSDDSSFNALWDRLENDWRRLKAEPYALVKDPYVKLDS